MPDSELEISQYGRRVSLEQHLELFGVAKRATHQHRIARGSCSRLTLGLPPSPTRSGFFETRRQESDNGRTPAARRVSPAASPASARADVFRLLRRPALPCAGGREAQRNGRPGTARLPPTHRRPDRQDVLHEARDRYRVNRIVRTEVAASSSRMDPRDHFRLRDQPRLMSATATYHAPASGGWRRGARSPSPRRCALFAATSGTSPRRPIRAFDLSSARASRASSSGPGSAGDPLGVHGEIPVATGVEDRLAPVGSLRGCLSSMARARSVRRLGRPRRRRWPRLPGRAVVFRGSRVSFRPREARTPRVGLFVCRRSSRRS